MHHHETSSLVRTSLLAAAAGMALAACGPNGSGGGTSGGQGGTTAQSGSGGTGGPSTGVGGSTGGATVTGGTATGGGSSTGVGGSTGGATGGDGGTGAGGGEPGPGSWSKSFPTPAWVEPRGLAVGADSTIVLVGTMTALQGGLSADLGGGPIPLPQLGTYGFIAKLDAAGNHVYSRTFGPPFGTFPPQGWLRVAIDPDGNAIIIGNQNTPIDFGCGAQGGGGFVTKLDPAGDCLWSKPVAVGDFRTGDVAVDESGDIVIGGMFEGSIDFGSGVFPSAGDADAVIARLDSGGQLLWVKTFGGPLQERLQSVAVDASGTIAVGGVAFDAGLVIEGTPVGTSGFFVATFDSMGQAQLVRGLGGIGQQMFDFVLPMADVAFDAQGGLLVAGSTDVSMDPSDLDLSPAGVFPAGFSDSFAAKLDPAGQVVWGRFFGGIATAYTYRILPHPSGKTILTGRVDGTQDFGAGPVSATFYPPFVAQLDEMGAPLSVWVVPTSLDCQAMPDVSAIGPAGEVVVAGQFYGTFDFGDGPLQSSDAGMCELGNMDAYLARLVY